MRTTFAETIAVIAAYMVLPERRILARSPARLQSQHTIPKMIPRKEVGGDRKNTERECEGDELRKDPAGDETGSGARKAIE